MSKEHWGTCKNNVQKIFSEIEKRTEIDKYRRNSNVNSTFEQKSVNVCDEYRQKMANIDKKVVNEYRQNSGE